MLHMNVQIPWHHCLHAAVFYIWTANLSLLLSGFDPPHPHTHTHTHTQIHTHTGSHGYRKCLQADSLRHQEPNSDDANGHDLIRQAMPPVKTCKMCSVINTFSAQDCTLLTCGAMGMKEILNIKHTLNMAITRLNCCSSTAVWMWFPPTCSQLHDKWFCMMMMKISFGLM